jgi:hypothetical protein
MSARLARISKVLHDDVGPTLCAVGLQVDLLLGDRGREIQAALEETVNKIRRLSYLAQENLPERFGLSKALELLPDFADPAFRGRISVRGEPDDADVFNQAAIELYRLSRIENISEILIEFSGSGFRVETRP